MADRLPVGLCARIREDERQLLVDSGPRRIFERAHTTLVKGAFPVASKRDQQEDELLALGLGQVLTGESIEPALRELGMVGPPGLEPGTDGLKG